LLEVEKMKGNILSTFEKKGTEAEDVAEKITKNPDLLPELITGIHSPNPKMKFQSAKVLRIVSERKPEILYSKMDFFAGLLDSGNNILKWVAMDIIANLATVDYHNKFNELFKKFYDHLYEGSLITAAHVVDKSGKIALSKPEFQDKITKELLKVEKIPLPTEECRNILMGKTITAFQVYYDKIKDKDKVVSFVKRQLNNSRNATKTKAEKFLKKI
jgi:hypothetical protein